MSEENGKLHKVIVDRSRCCGYGLCAAICPDVYKLDGDGIVYLESEHVPPRARGNRHRRRRCLSGRGNPGPSPGRLSAPRDE